MPRLASLVPAVALVGVGAVIAVACSKPAEVTAVESVSESRFADLEKKVHDLTAENDAAKQALGASGNDTVSVARAVTEMRDEIRRLKEQLAARGSAATGGAPDASAGGPGSTGAAAPLGAPQGWIAPSASDGAFPPEQVATFDRLWEAAQKLRSEKAERERLHDVLSRAEVSLSADQEAAVLKLQREYTDKRGELFKSMGSPRRAGMQSDADRNEIRAKLEELQTQHEADLRATLPAADAEKVVAAMKQSYPGFFPRPDRASRNGMGN